MDRWQYMSLVIKWDEKKKRYTLKFGNQEYAAATPAELLNPVGADGWELVGFVGDYWTGYLGGYSNIHYVAMLKRRY